MIRNTIYTLIAAGAWLAVIALTAASARADTQAEFERRLFAAQSVTIPVRIVQAPGRSIEDQRQAECIATAIYHEARGEPLTGMVAVGEVVRNRVKAGFAQDACAVIQAKNQFEFVSLNRTAILEPKMFAASMYVAQRVQLGETPNVAKGATFFHGKHITPTWSKSMHVTLRVGHHVFLTPSDVSLPPVR